MTNIVPPVVLDERGELQVSVSATAACEWVEAIDVEDGVYAAFDRDGRVLELGVKGGQVSLELAAGRVTNSEELERRIREYVQRVGNDRVGIADPNTATVQEMLEALLRAE